MKVRLYAPHTHAGKRYVPGPEGVEIDVSEADAKWLKEHTKVLQRPQSDAAATDTTKA